MIKIFKTISGNLEREGVGAISLYCNNFDDRGDQCNFTG